MRILFILVCFVFISLPAGAAQSSWVSADNVRGKLLSAVDTTEGLSALDAAVQISLADGWHTYWRVPGDAGLPPRFDWSASVNVKSARIDWPAPTRKDESGFTVFAYDGEVMFPLRIELEEAGKPARLATKIDIMVCKDICIPDVLELSLDLPAGGEQRSSEARLIKAAQDKIPVEGDLPNLRIDAVVASAEALVITLESRKGFEDLDIFASADGYGFTAKPLVIPDDADKRKAMVRLIKPEDVDALNSFLNGKKLRIVLVNGRDAVEKIVNF